MEEKMNKYIDILKTWNGELENLCFELYQMLIKENDEDRLHYFQMICEKIEDIDSDESLEIASYFEEGEIEQLKGIYGKYIDEVINAVRKKIDRQKLSVSDFYKTLWNTVFNDSMLTNEKEKAFGLLWIIADNGIPYYEIGTPISMENEDYKKIVDENKLSLERISYILSIPFEQRTEPSSLILQELNEKDDITQAVLLSQAFAMSVKREMRGLGKLIQSIQEDKKE